MRPYLDRPHLVRAELKQMKQQIQVTVKAADELGADFIATGHYCRKETIQTNGSEVYRSTPEIKGPACRLPGMAISVMR